MKKNIVVLLSLFFATVAIAQPPNLPKPPTPEERLKHFAEKLDKEMTLTNDQKQKVLAEYKVFFGKMDQLHDKFPPPPPPPPPPSGMKEQREKIIASRDEKLKKILTEAQFSKLKEMEKKRKREGHDGMPPPPPPMEP